MHFGGAMFFTEYSMSAMELAHALEERGFESVWAPEHSHIPLSRKTPFPGGGDLPKQYADVMDPFVVLAAASQVAKRIKFGTGVLLVQQRDAIQTAKLVASIDQVSQGRFLFGVGGGWNQDEMENHGTVYASRSRATPAGQDAGTAEFGSLRKRGALIVTRQIDYSSMCAHSVKYFRL